MTTEKKTTETATAKEERKLTANFQVSGTTVLRGDSKTQSAFNLRVSPQDTEALLNLEALADHFNKQPERADKTVIEVVNEDGDAYLTVKMDERSINLIRRARAFEVAVKGMLRVTGTKGGQFKGELMVSEAAPVDILNGGRLVEVVVEKAPVASSQGIRGFRI
jgi:hypothetical protein